MMPSKLLRGMMLDMLAHPTKRLDAIPIRLFNAAGPLHVLLERGLFYELVLCYQMLALLLARVPPSTSWLLLLFVYLQTLCWGCFVDIPRIDLTTWRDL